MGDRHAALATSEATALRSQRSAPRGVQAPTRLEAQADAARPGYGKANNREGKCSELANAYMQRDFDDNAEEERNEENVRDALNENSDNIKLKRSLFKPSRKQNESSGVMNKYKRGRG